jgi:hypothetical protein
MVRHKHGSEQNEAVECRKHPATQEQVKGGRKKGSRLYDSTYLFLCHLQRPQQLLVHLTVVLKGDRLRKHKGRGVRGGGLLLARQEGVRRHVQGEGVHVFIEGANRGITTGYNILIHCSHGRKQAE